MTEKKIDNSICRRSFLSSTALAGSGLIASKQLSAQTADKNRGDLNIALIGAGEQGQNLLKSCIKIPGIRISAVCDIWEAFNLNRASRYLKRFKQEHKTYSDYREMLKSEKGLDAVIIATPDFCHADQTVASLRAGVNVYCESPMSNTVEGAERMLKAASESGKLLQIGFQRRSNPKYLHSCENLLREIKLLGQITTVNGQWNRAVEPGRGWPRRAPVDKKVLEENGYPSMSAFRNWRWQKNLGGGPLASFGSHQIDVFNWFLGCMPDSVMASGGIDYYSKKTHHMPDSVMALLEYQTKAGTVRAFNQIVTNNSNLGDFEKFLGCKGSMIISESAPKVNVYREESVTDWDRWVNLDYLSKPEKKKEHGTAAGGTGTGNAEGSGAGASGAGDAGAGDAGAGDAGAGDAGAGDAGAGDAGADHVALNVTETVKPTLYTVPVNFSDPPHKPHLENFFETILGKEGLNCPGETGYAAALVVSKINEALKAEKKIYLKS